VKKNATGTGMGAPPGAPTRHSVTHAAVEALVRFSEQERVWAASQAYESFAGILEEHAASLDQTRDLLLEALARGRDATLLSQVANQLREEAWYVHKLAGTGEESDAE